jgi:SAM-dependent methyltransferase
MVAAARARLATFASRVNVRQADATELPFPDNRFDAVLSFIMLHHVINWEAALGEAVRVPRPGGVLVGYDLAATHIAHWLHQADDTRHRLATPTSSATRLPGCPSRRCGYGWASPAWSCASAPAKQPDKPAYHQRDDSLTRSWSMLNVGVVRISAAGMPLVVLLWVRAPNRSVRQ